MSAMDLSKIPEIVALNIENLTFTWIEAEDFLSPSFFFFFFFFFNNGRTVLQVILSALHSLKTTFDKTLALNERVCIPN